MLDVGTRIQVEGQAYRVTGWAGAGGEAETYQVQDPAGGKLLLKRFHDHHDPEVSLRRSRFLLEQQLERRCPLLTPPRRLIEPRGYRSWCGYLSCYRQGQLLAELLDEPEVDLLANLQLAVALVHGVAVLHEQGLSHGDIHPRNVIIERRGTVMVPYWIDLDNFNAEGVEPSRAWGALEYVAPEVRAAMAANRPHPPAIGADRFSLSCLLHELLLRRHVAAGHDQSPEAFHRAMSSGRWLQDPARGPIDQARLGGLSNQVLSAKLCELMRRGLSCDIQTRPSADAWRAALLEAADQLFLCPACGYPNLIDPSKHRCPACRAGYPVLALRLPGGGRLLIQEAAVVVGRAQVPSPHVSAQHAVLRRLGPETWIEPRGRNGTWRRAPGGGWVRLAQARPCLLEAGDVLRLADVELELVTVEAATSAGGSASYEGEG